MRTVYAVVTEGETMPRLELEEVRGLDGLKEANVSLFSPITGKGLKDRNLRVAVVSGLNNAKKLIADMRDGKRRYDFVEVMACPGGCIGGGGQPRTKDKEALKKRMEAIYSLDRRAAVRKSHENPDVLNMYDGYLAPGFGSEIAVKTLHVHRPEFDGPKVRVFPCECRVCGLQYDGESPLEDGPGDNDVDGDGDDKGKCDSIE